MTEEEARGWCADRFDAAAVDRLTTYVEALSRESEQQNLIAPSTKAEIWARHIVDSAQLLALAPPSDGTWVDIGSGAGLPGVVIAAVSDRPVVLVEPRRLRAEFLVRVADALGVSHRVLVRQCNADQLRTAAAPVVSARAVAKTDKLFADSRGFADLSTTFILPKGASARSELENARKTWQGTFHVEQSITDPAAGIIVATQVQPR